MEIVVVGVLGESLVEEGQNPLNPVCLLWAIDFSLQLDCHSIGRCVQIDSDEAAYILYAAGIFGTFIMTSKSAKCHALEK